MNQIIKSSGSRVAKTLNSEITKSPNYHKVDGINIESIDDIGVDKNSLKRIVIYTDLSIETIDTIEYPLTNPDECRYDVIITIVLNDGEEKKYKRRTLKHEEVKKIIGEIGSAFPSTDIKVDDHSFYGFFDPEENRKFCKKILTITISATSFIVFFSLASYLNSRVLIFLSMIYLTTIIIMGLMKKHGYTVPFTKNGKFKNYSHNHTSTSKHLHKSLTAVDLKR